MGKSRLCSASQMEAVASHRRNRPSARAFRKQSTRLQKPTLCTSFLVYRAISRA